MIDSFRFVTEFWAATKTVARPRVNRHTIRDEYQQATCRVRFFRQMTNALTIVSLSTIPPRTGDRSRLYQTDNDIRK